MKTTTQHTMKRLYVILLATALMIASCSHRNKEKEAAPAVKATVKTAVATETDNYLELPGQLQSATSANLSTRIMGQVSHIYVDMGDRVKKGDLLLSIRSNDLDAKKAQVEANLMELQSALDNAQKNQQRIQTLFNNESASQKELDDINTHVNVLLAKKNAVLQAKKEVTALLSYAIIRAPYAGTITSRTINTGDMANPGQPLMGIETNGKFEVTARIPEYQATLAKVGMKVAIQLNNQQLSGIVSQVNQSGSYTGAQFLLKVLVNDEVNQHHFIKSGLFARVLLPSGKTQKILVSEEAIITRGQLTGLWTVNHKEKAMLRWVTIGKKHNDKVEILSGLNDNERYIIPGKNRLTNGTKIAVNE